METPISTKKQQKSSLSAKKNKSKETIKNVLATPFKNHFWPKITSEDHKTLTQALMNNLPKMRENHINIPWSELKNIPKADRKKFRTDYCKNETGQAMTNEESKNMYLGINSVEKLLTVNKISAILIASDVNPILLVQHLINLAVLHRVPVLIYDDLRNMLKECTGISSVVLGINKDTPAESSLNLIRKTIHEIFQKFPPPIDHINFYRSLINKDDDTFSIRNDEKTVESDAEVDEIKMRETIHLKRANKKRVFIPPLTDNFTKTKVEVDETGFLAFSNEPVEAEVVQPKYKSLIIKRLKGDPNRNKRKVENLKKKRVQSR